ncbi:MAG: DapH/DapD/GlmU-related protein [Candidatus Margulisiibacteriota bacterium]|nr:DapH/DapD/GlmU-related protein [Candidatus Margulisiibacteriota bacterium]
MENRKLYKNVKMGANSLIGDFVIIGVPPKGKKDGELETVIGDNAVIRSHTVIYAGNQIGDNFQTGHGVMVRELNTIGDDVSVGTGSVLEHHLNIGNEVRIHSQVFIPEYSNLEDKCWLGPKVAFTNAMYPRSKDVKENLKGPTIMREAKIGANSTLLPGITIGERALVGAGSVVTKDVPREKVVAGNPAKVIKDIKELPY